MKNGELIRSYRKRKKMTMKELAAKIGVSEQAISQYERSVRNPNFVTLQNIAYVLDIPLEYFTIKLSSVLIPQTTSPEGISKLNSQIDKYISGDDKLRVRLFCKILEFYTYDVDISNNTAVVIDRISNQPYATIPLDSFILLSEMMHSQHQGIINNLPYMKKEQNNHLKK